MRPDRSVRLPRPLAAALTVAALAGGAAGAQVSGADGAAPDARWQPWYGCWRAAPDSLGPAADAAAAPVTCVTPAAGSAVEVTTVAGGKVVGRDRVDAGGARRRFDREGCTGWEQADWSPDGRRVYLRSEMTCANDVRRTGDGVLAVTRAGEWLDVRGLTVGGYTGVRTARYRPAGEPAGLPADVASALRGRTLGVETARAAAGAPATTGDVVEVTRRAGAPVAAAWVAELGQRFAVDARRLAALADAGVPGSVTDVLVATAFPGRFALGPSGAERSLRDAGDADDGRARPGPVAVMTPMYGGWGSPGWGGQGWGGGWGGFGWDALGFGPFGFNALNGGFGRGRGFFPGGGYWGAGPVVVVRPSGSEAAGERARVVPGRGYTRGDSPESGSARPSGGGASHSPSVSRDGYSGGGSGSSTGSGGSGSSSGGRTAKPRP